jgi:hypothetical protein
LVTLPVLPSWCQKAGKAKNPFPKRKFFRNLVIGIARIEILKLSIFKNEG